MGDTCFGYGGVVDLLCCAASVDAACKSVLHSSLHASVDHYFSRRVSIRCSVTRRSAHASGGVRSWLATTISGEKAAPPRFLRSMHHHITTIAPNGLALMPCLQIRLRDLNNDSSSQRGSGMNERSVLFIPIHCRRCLVSDEHVLFQCRYEDEGQGQSTTKVFNKPISMSLMREPARQCIFASWRRE
jgi:hypothetical protein